MDKRLRFLIPYHTSAEDRAFCPYEINRKAVEAEKKRKDRKTTTFDSKPESKEIGDKSSAESKQPRNKKRGSRRRSEKEKQKLEASLPKATKVASETLYKLEEILSDNRNGQTNEREIRKIKTIASFGLKSVSATERFLLTKNTAPYRPDYACPTSMKKDTATLPGLKNETYAKHYGNLKLGATRDMGGVESSNRNRDVVKKDIILPEIKLPAHRLNNTENTAADKTRTKVSKVPKLPKLVPESIKSEQSFSQPRIDLQLNATPILRLPNVHTAPKPAKTTVPKLSCDATVTRSSKPVDKAESRPQKKAYKLPPIVRL